jgi:tRNA(fMet)-specific endonuclease VapC
MGSSISGLVLDSSVLIAAERRKLTAFKTIQQVRQTIGETPLVLSVVTVAEIGHGIYRANTQEIRELRRSFLDDLKNTIPIYPVTTATAEIIARIGGEQAAQGINLPLADLIIGACALELGYALGTSNTRDFKRIPGVTLISL